MIRLILADDHAIVRHGLKQILAFVADVTVAGEAGCGDELLEVLKKTACDIVLLDMNMPGLSGVDLIKRISTDYPELPILILSTHFEGPIANRALKAGAFGYLTKDNEPEILAEAIRKVASGGKYIDPLLVETLIFSHNTESRAQHEDLSEREMQIFIMLTSGRTVSEIADELFLSIKTVSTHKSRLMGKLNIQTQTDLIRYAIRHQLIDA